MLAAVVPVDAGAAGSLPEAGDTASFFVSFSLDSFSLDAAFPFEEALLSVR